MCSENADGTVDGMRPLHRAPTIRRRDQFAVNVFGMLFVVLLAGIGLLIGAARADALHRAAIPDRSSSSDTTDVSDSSGISATSPTHQRENARDAQVIRLLTGPRPDLGVAELPADFGAVMGYQPVVVDGYPINPSGGCSSPVPLPTRFEQPCRAHDLGYDVLRHAARSGQPLGGWARRDLDSMLVDRLRQLCHDPGCLAAAQATRAALAVNTWRQHDGPPTAENTAQTLGSGVARIWSAMADVRVGAGS